MCVAKRTGPHFRRRRPPPHRCGGSGDPINDSADWISDNGDAV